jgi:serine/threonine protein phosphatase PrpC
VAVEAGDVFLLCTDGLWEYVDDAQLESALANAPSPHDWLRALEQKRPARRLAQAAPRQLHRPGRVGGRAGP